MMDYIGRSVRKISSIFSSPASNITLGKRKAGRMEDIEEKDPADGESRLSTRDYASDGEYNRCSDYWPPQKLIRKHATVERANTALHSVNEAMRKAQIEMGKGVATPAVQLNEQDIQEELQRQQRQEEEGRRVLLKQQRESQTPPSNSKKRLVAVFNNERTTVTSTPELPLNSADPKTSGLETTLTTHTWEALTSEEKWAIQPNRRARELLDSKGHDAIALLKDLREPAYACRDMELRDGIWKLMDQIEELAKRHFSWASIDSTRLRPVLESLQKETVKIIGCVAMGGPGGARGWDDLFLADDKRQALVCAIICNVLVEQVFQHIFFGGTESQMREVNALQSKHSHEDVTSQTSEMIGVHIPTRADFDRNVLHAAKIRCFLTPSSSSRKCKLPNSSTHPFLHLPPNFNTHISSIIAALFAHLTPFAQLAPSSTRTASTALLPDLHSLTVLAGQLSLHMRLDSQTVYHWTPVFRQGKEGEGEELGNTADDTAQGGDANAETANAETPRMQSVARKQTDSQEKQLHIAILPGLIAYRRGGWEVTSSHFSSSSSSSALASHEIVQSKAKSKSKQQSQDIGFRTRRLTDTWVLYC